MQERYKDMEASHGRSFNLEHCSKLHQHSQKWEFIEEESPPKDGSLTETDDDDKDDDGPRNKNKPDGNKKAKDKIKRESKASSLRDKIDIMVQSNEEMKQELAEKKAQEKQESGPYSRKKGCARPPLRRGKPLPRRTRLCPSFLQRRTRS